MNNFFSKEGQIANLYDHFHGSGSSEFPEKSHHCHSDCAVMLDLHNTRANFLLSPSDYAGRSGHRTHAMLILVQVR